MAFTNDAFRLDGKVAIVTGAGGRGNSIGRAYALGLAQAGAAVVVADLNEEGAQRVAGEITDAGGQAIGVKVDITDTKAVADMVSTAQDRFGGVDILVNNAALMAELSYGPLMTTSRDDWDRTFDVNLIGALNCTQAVVPIMRQRGGGKIVNQASAGAFPAETLYGITKLALVGLTTTFARELGPDKINVNAIAPGNTATDAGQGLLPADSPTRKYLDMHVSMRVVGQPDELVGALLLLCSAAGDWITGQVLNVDGGWVVRP